MLPKHHQMMLEDGCPPALLRLPGQAPPAPKPEPRPATPPDQPAVDDDADLRQRADMLWRNWMPTRESRSRPRKATFLKRLRDERKAKTPMAKIGPREQALRDLRESRAGAKPKKVHGLAAINAAVIRKIETPTAPAAETKPEPTAKPEAATQETTTVKKPKTKKSAKKPAAKRKPAAKAKTTKPKKAPAAKKPSTSKRGIPAQDVADFVCRQPTPDNPLGGASMEELVKKFGIEAHPMRAKIHYVRHQLGYGVEVKDGRYHGTPPKNPG